VVVDDAWSVSEMVLVCGSSIVVALVHASVVSRVHAYDLSILAKIDSEPAVDGITAKVFIPLWRVPGRLIGHDVVVLEEASRRDRMSLAVEPEELDTLPQVLHKEHRELRELESDQPGISLGKRPMRGLDLLDGKGLRLTRR
jgi:hypothetical protein